MIFLRLDFILTLVIGLFLYYRINNEKCQKSCLLVFSIIFYGLFSFKFLTLIISSSVIIWILSNINSKSKICYLLSIMIPVFNLFYYKYYNFFLNEFCMWFGIENHSIVSIFLPLGLSFYSFKQLSFVFQFHRKEIEKCGIIDYLNYILFFPTIISGPIDKASKLIPQFSTRKTYNEDLITDGFKQFCWGAFKKVVLADSIATIVNTVWLSYTDYNWISLLFVSFLYSLQIYFDFSGYSDMAISIGKLFGFYITNNFKYPYFSRSIPEFWSRWHITLTKWFTENIYIPLGGGKVGKTRKFINTMVVFSLSGLWHGANWTFVLWGIYHGLLFIPSIIFNQKKEKDEIISISFSILLKIIVIFLFVNFGWIMFRASNINDFIGFVTGIFTFQSGLYIQGLHINFIIIIMSFVTIIYEWKYRCFEYPLIGSLSKKGIIYNSFVLSILILSIILFSKVGDGEFIYATF